MSKCNTCGRNADTPYRVYDSRGKAIQGCIDDFHTGHLIGESARWHNRPEAKKWRAAVKKHLRELTMKNPRKKRKSAASKKNPSARTIKPREIATRYKFCVEFSDNQKTWTEYGAFTAREIAEDIAHHLAKKYPTVYIRVTEK